MTAKQKNGVLVGLAVVIALAAFVKAWFSAQGVSIGLWSIEVCDHGCHSIRWDNVPGAQDDLYMAGYAAFAAAIVGAAAIIAFVVGNQPAARFARIALTVALIGMVYFILRALVFDALNHVDIGWALVVGPVATIAARQLLPRSR